MDHKIVEFIEQSLRRRAFLGKLCAATTALMTGVLFGPETAEANPIFADKCCRLCKDPATCSYSGCTCEWSWQCCQTCHPERWRCDECIVTLIGSCAPPCQTNTACGKKAICPGVKCSKRELVSNTCPGPYC
jgi:hypothetical protein